MMLINYLIKTVLISGALFGYYWIFLRNRIFHGFNRLFLLSIPVLSLSLPALQLHIPEWWKQTKTGNPIHILTVGQGKFEEAFTIYPNQHTGLSWGILMVLASITVSMFLLIRFFKTVQYINRLRKNNPSLQLTRATLYFVSEKGTPFSFFRSIFWGKEIELNSETGQHILKHELYHVIQHHSVDVVVIELLSVVFWFIPFFHLIRQELKAIHEYGADAYATSDSDRNSYARILLQTARAGHVPLTNPFFKNQIKRRIAMITNNKSKSSLATRLVIMPFILLLLCLFGFQKYKSGQKIFTTSNSIRVVIDAGHGGVFAGATFRNVTEKDINLSISRKIQELSKYYNVEVILTRSDDASPGGDVLKKSLEYRTALAEKSKAGLFISIHTNMTSGENNQNQNEHRGFEIYIPKNTNNEYANSVKLGSAITEIIKQDYPISPELKEQATGVMVLDKATVPAILIECGYLDNAADLKYLQDDKNQEKIARDILEGIKRYGETAETQAASFKNQISDGPGTDTVTFDYLNKNVDNDSVATVEYSKTGKSGTFQLKNGHKYVVLLDDEFIKNNERLFDPKMKIYVGHYMDLDTSAPHKNPETEAEYPGGQEAWYAYLRKNLIYPEKAVAKEIQGTVITEFIVHADGMVTDIKAISGPEELRASCIQVIRASGKWIPATDRGTAIKSYKRQPLNFRLGPNTDSVVFGKILTYEEMKKINTDSIQFIDVNKGTRQIKIRYKDGKNATVFLNDEVQNKIIPDTLIFHN
jgi:N-acetylmuramoyl-L-alanine amidase